MPSDRSTQIEIITEDALQARVVSRRNCKDVFVTAPIVAQSAAPAVFRSVAELLQGHGAAVVVAEVFGLPDEGGTGTQALHQAFGNPDFPLTWFDEGCRNDPPWAGIIVQAVAGPEIQPVHLRGRCIGSIYSDAYARYCMLAGMLPEDIAAEPGRQTRMILDDIVAVLAGVDMAFQDVVRTWFRNHRILDWYDEFNRVRTAFFHEHKVFDGRVPASTGIGTHNAHGAALACGLLAVQGMGEDVQAYTVPSPLQESPQPYGSSFSRAVELATPEYRQVLISGTASIAPSGETIHLDDVEAQIDCTLEVVGAILESRGMSWGDVTRSIAYFKHAEDLPKLEACWKTAGLPRVPMLVVKSDVCRDDLLFETEVDAIVPNQ
jgi:enamine deaminase RidA (YjgF/YER057c/UK114 family)